MLVSCAVSVWAEKLVIAHRGASGYLPEHTLESKALAVGQKADYLEQDLVMTKDNHLVVIHDHFLDGLTDVTQKFPKRARQDGKYYVMDFTLDEIRSLRMTENFKTENGRQTAVYPKLFRCGRVISAFTRLKKSCSLSADWRNPPAKPSAFIPKSKHRGCIIKKAKTSPEPRWPC